MSGAGAALSGNAVIGVIGAGAMGAGIAQIAAIAGHPVWLHDLRPGAAEAAIAGIRAQIGKLAAKGKLPAERAAAASAALQAAGTLDALRDATLVVEAIVEDLDAKRALFTALEERLADDAILASNTSSISITAIGAALKRPERLVGMHFFNPAPLMPLVEVISGVATDKAVADTVFATSAAWGKTPVLARSTPGFIVNRVARPFYAEGLRLLQEGVCDAATLDAVIRDAGGFRMGPCELMDLIGHDVNYAVTRSVFDAFYGDPRFAPSFVQLELVQAGHLGRKRGRGFYDYRDGAVKAEPVSASAQPRPWRIALNLGHPVAAAWSKRMYASAAQPLQTLGSVADGRIATIDDRTAVFATDGRSATALAQALGLPAVVTVDLMLDPATAKRAAIAVSAHCSDAARDAVIGMLQSAGLAVSVLADSPGLAVFRTVAMLANEAFDAVHQQVCSEAAVDVAMRGGVNYPIGPVEWARRIGLARVLAGLDHLQAHYREPRYRASARLRHAVLVAPPATGTCA
ncbi:MAG: 3-hydroxyacyl-CoA dehydrogenase [Xanthomonadaceae bacterium]|nr:3-hydroxyacyl-CoA dehydrogenase [Xanthomonadaceae bacterium]